MAKRPTASSTATAATGAATDPTADAAQSSEDRSVEDSHRSKKSAPTRIAVPACILSDIEGTTTSISFVRDVLFVYAREQLQSYLQRQWHTASCQADIRALYQQVSCPRV